MKIAVYTIALNEEQFVERWYNSAKDADYLLIADTGSTDKTIDLAKSFGINVVSISIKPWRFENARNASMNALPEDIDMCIALDMDEILVDGWREELEKIKPETTRPRYQYTWSWNGDKPGLQYGGDKIHSRNGYRWKHPVHEVLVNDGIAEVQEWVGLEIHHHPDHTKSRGQYLPLLELAVQEDPTDDRNQYYLAREYFFNGMQEKAAEMFIRHLGNAKATWGPERSASCRYLAKCNPEFAEDWLIKANLESSNRRESAVELAQHYYSKENWDKSLEWAKIALLTEKKPLDYLCEEFAWGSLPHDLAAIASWNLGKFEEAFKHGTDALYLEPSNQRLFNNIEIYLKSLDKQ